MDDGVWVMEFVIDEVIAADEDIVLDGDGDEVREVVDVAVMEAVTDKEGVCETVGVIVGKGLRDASKH